MFLKSYLFKNNISLSKFSIIFVGWQEEEEEEQRRELDFTETEFLKRYLLFWKGSEIRGSAIRGSEGNQNRRTTTIHKYVGIVFSVTALNIVRW